MVCHADPCAKSVQYLDLLNTLIFPKIFSTGDILTLVDHTLIDHTACIFPTERLGDFIEIYMGPKGILRCSFVPKISKVGHEMAELWLFSHWEVA